MDDLRDMFHHGRRTMLQAFADLSTLARWAAVDVDAITGLHGQFFDGNVQVKQTFARVILLAEIWRPERHRSQEGDQ